MSSFSLGQAVNIPSSNEQPHRDKGQRYYPTPQDPLPKERHLQLPWRWKQSLGCQAETENHLRFCTAILWEPTRPLPSHVLRTQNETTKKAKDIPGRGRDWPPRSTQEHLHQSQFKDPILTNILPTHLNLEKWGTWNPALFSQQGTTHTDENGSPTFGKNC